MVTKKDELAPFHSPEIQPPLNSNWAAKRKVAQATRQLIENLVTCTTSDEELLAIGEQISEQASILKKAPRLFGEAAFEEVSDFPEGMHIGYELNSMDGKSNPVAPPINIWLEGDKAFGEVTMGWQYEGPPRCIHGGFIAALFDQFLGVAQKLTGQPGFTGTLSVRYIKPTPLDRPLRLEGRVDHIEGRKNYLVGEMWAGDVMTATCEALFISVSAEQMRGRT